MRSKNLIQFLAAIGFLFSITSCEKETEEFKTEAIADYLPLAVGKYITYRLDSTVFTNLGRNEELHRYQVKHVVDAQIADNLGRPSYRILRYLRDSLGTQPWVENGTYFITPLTDEAEVIEDNLRYIKLHLPFKLNTDWKGNKYLARDPFGSIATFFNDDDMNAWDYNIENYESTTTIGGKSVNDVYTIFQIDEAGNAPVTNYSIPGYRTLATERYAKNIGLVTRDFIMWEYQPPSPGSPPGILGFKTGFGIKMWMVDHN
ncbi:MAG TPA: hypothetical protein VFU29_17960 [Chitinophagaceae bacterium]|nr:hypothetical protein [Chitinophagaceae bacterium]